MYVLDTNVISELMKENPHHSVSTWIARHDATELFITAITLAELHYGIQGLPKGKRKSALKKALEGIPGLFADRVLAFDSQCAEYYAEAIIKRRDIGKPISIPDAQIAAICRRYQGSLATRNTRDFDDLELAVLNPWDAL